MVAGSTFPAGGAAIVIGARGGIGASLIARLQNASGFSAVVGLARRSEPLLDLTSEASVERAAAHVASLGVETRLIVNATGILHGPGVAPEKSWRDLDAERMSKVFAINAIGPALLMKHFLPLLPRTGKSVFAALSARVGSIGDNDLGGWYSYRASKAALNQLVRTAAIELRRQRPEAICVALHPGTVATELARPFATTGLEVQPPDTAARRLLEVIERLTPADTAGFLDQRGRPIAW